MRNLLLLVGLLVFTEEVFSQKERTREEIINDSSSIYSISPKRPFKYGFPYSKEECLEYFDYYNGDFKIKNGDVVADIGAASGWMDAMLSIYLDSVTFYIQDIDTSYSSQAELDKAVNYFSQYRTHPQTNTFIFVLGDEKKTNVPDSTFDKIILNNTFHEIIYPLDITEDLQNKLKSNGTILVREGFSNKYRKNKQKGCNITGYKAMDVVMYFQYSGFKLIRASEPENSFSNCLEFSKSSKSVEFSFSDPRVTNYIEMLDRLNKRSVAKDSIKTKKILNSLLAGKDEIHKTYRTLDDYLYQMAEFYLSDHRYLEALNVFKIELALYPEAEEINTTIAYVYEKLKRDDLALVYYRKALLVDPQDDYSKKAIIEIEEKLKRKRSNSLQNR